MGSGGGSDLSQQSQTKANLFFCLQILALASFCFVLFIVFAAERLEVLKHSFSPQLSSVPEVRSLTFELGFAGVFWLVLWSCLSVIMLCLHAV